MPVIREAAEVPIRKVNFIEISLKTLYGFGFRLSQPLPVSLHTVPGPTREENNIAEQCVDGLTELTKKVAPATVAPVPAIRRALGVPVAPPVPDPEPDLETELRQFLEQV